MGPDDEPGVTRATVLAGTAERVSDINVARAQVAKESAEAQLVSTADLDDATRVLLEASVARAELRLRVAGNA